MITRPAAHELILGSSFDPIFGPILLFGAGGTSVEVVNDTAIGLPPLDDVLAGDLIDSTRIGKLLRGYRDRKPADRAAIIRSLNAMSAMMVDFPALKSMDINPLIADENGVMALDARIEIRPEAVEEIGPNRALAIRPYPEGWEKIVDVQGKPVRIRPIVPADVALYPDFLARVSPEDIRFRFLAPRPHFSDQMLKRMTQLDYAREIAFLAVDEASGELMAIGRLSAEPNHEKAEYGLLVRTDLQGKGLGFLLLKQILDYARADGLSEVEGIILNDNEKMLAMVRDFGFVVERHPDDARLSLARYVLKARSQA